MDYQEALNRLSNHANSPLNDDFPPENSLIFNLWQATVKGRALDIEDYVEEVISCFEVVNDFLNGEKPSETFTQKTPESNLVFIASNLISSLLEFSIILKNKGILDSNEIAKLDLFTWKISTAWCLILDGDIDSLKSEINIQGRAKEIF